jgi:hypothetical protein
LEKNPECLSIFVNNTKVDFRDVRCETGCIKLARVRKLIDQILKPYSVPYSPLNTSWLTHVYTIRRRKKKKKKGKERRRRRRRGKRSKSGG